ncbi:hypothetical protein FRC08_007395 [Ceratobasidium sp. 394]|nr:hypothetical protein FRC08_007395 [Ceratobasidium sp. 394]
MPSQTPTPAPKRKAVVFTHYEPGRGGKAVPVKRKRKEAIQTVHPIPQRASSSTAHARPTPAPAVVKPGVEFFYDFDDGAGAEVHACPQGATSPMPSKDSPNSQLKNWKDNLAHSYIHALYTRDASPHTANRCSRCTTTSPTLFRCRSCIGAFPVCQSCILEVHRHFPLHSVLAWTGSCWEDASLADLGLVCCLGHEGSPCDLTRNVSTILVGHVLGFLSVKIRYCTHPGAPSKAVQLLQIGIFPCSDIDPQSAFTVDLLEHFTIFSTLGKTSGFRYYSVLQRLTNTGFPSKTSDRYRELLQTHRKYAHVMALKRAGTLFQQDAGAARNGSLALECIACPRPGINFNFGDLLPEEIQFFRFWISYDGNFRNPRKAKKIDADDVCFTDGLMYFVAQVLYKRWLDSKAVAEGKTNGARPDCDNHKAAVDKFVRWGGLDVTGVGACTCARHSFFLPQGMVDFRKGESFPNTNYAIASTITHFRQYGELLWGVTYDIFCHWFTQFLRQLINLPQHIALPVTLDIIGGVPKFHIIGHIEKCRILHSLNYKRFVGRIEGEGCERAWAFLNETAGSTSEKSPGARWDAINYILGDWNFEKMITMVTFLLSKFKEAKRLYAQQLSVFTELDASLPPAMTSQWQTESTDPVKGPDGRWTSPFFGKYDAGENLQEALRQEQAHEEADSGTSGQRLSLSKWIVKAIELENSMDKLRTDATELTANSTPRQHNIINDRRKMMLSRIDALRQERERYMGSLGDPDHPNRHRHDSPHPEYSELGLPSAYQGSSLVAVNCLQPPRAEASARRAECNSAIQTMRNLLGAKAFALRYKRKNVVGEIATTRAEGLLKDLRNKVERARRRYHRSREALLRLDLLSSDHSTYLPVGDDDLKMLAEYLDEDSSTLGQGSRNIPWIWRSTAAENNEDWHVEALKVEWFRARQRYLQWEEELKIVKREMVMSLKSFQHSQRLWEARGRQIGLSRGMAEYAIRKARFFEQLATDVLSRGDKVVNDPVVRLEWATAQWPKSL